jgi:hypothetical protein
VTLAEGNAGTSSAGFTVSLSNPSSQTITVQYQTANGTATAGSDYVAIGLTTLTFNPGVTSLPVNVTVTGDFVDEVDETFSVNLSNAVNAPVADNSGLGTITDDDTAGFTIVESGGNTTVTEGTPGTTDTFTIVLTSQPLSAVVINIANPRPLEVTIQSVNPIPFLPGDWDTPQVVTVRGGAVGFDDGDQLTNLTVSIVDASSDDAFDGVADQIVVVTTIDIDPP